MVDNPKRAVIFIAVSSLEQMNDDKVSLDYQEAECRKLAAERGYTVVDVLSVDGFSRSESDVVDALDEFRSEGIFAYDKLREYWKRRNIDVVVVYHDSRLGRSAALYTYAFENLLTNNIVIDRVLGGLVTHKDRRILNALGIISATSDTDRLRDQYQPGMNKRLEQGKPIATRDTFTHRKVRNSTGKSTTYAVREENRLACEMVARWVVERHSYYQVAVLTAAHGFRTDTGRYIWDSDLRTILLSPISWGNIARLYKNRHGIWAFDETAPLPENVVINRATHEPMWTGDLSLALKEELRRRELLATGRAWPDKVSAFSGLLVCGYCGQRMAFQKVPKASYIWQAYCCNSNYHYINRIQPVKCEAKRKSIRFEDVLEWFDKRLRLAIATTDLSAVLGKSPSANTTDELIALHRQREIKESEANRYLESRNLTPGRLQGNLQTLIERAARELEHLDNEIQQLEHRATMQRRSDVSNRRALVDVAGIGIDAFWKLPQAQINQYLFALLGDHRLAVYDGEITDVIVSE